MKNIFPTLCINALVIIFCLNFSQGSADMDDKKPSWNCQGTLIDSESREHTIEYMTISGLYEKIPVYYEPSSSEKNPSGHTQLINLRDIKKISANPAQEKKKFMDRNYIEITVTFKKGAQENYLVEEYRELWYFLAKGPSGKAEVKFDRFKSLTIDKCSVKLPEESDELEDTKKTQARADETSLFLNVKNKVNVAFDNVRDSFKHLFA